MGSQVPLKRCPAPPQFPVHVYCGQTAGWMKMPLGTEVELGPGHIVLDGDPTPPLCERGTTAPPPLFGPCLLWLRSPISATAELLLTQPLTPWQTWQMSSARVTDGRMVHGVSFCEWRVTHLCQVIIRMCFVCLLEKHHYKTFKWRDTTSGFPISPGSAEAVVGGGGKIKHPLIIFFLSNIFAKNLKIGSCMSKLQQTKYVTISRQYIPISTAY